MNQDLATLDDLKRYVDAQMERLAEARRQRDRYEGVSPEARLWLALVPSWTLPLAQAAGFPASGDLGALFERLTLDGILEALPPPLVDEAEKPTLYAPTRHDRQRLLEATLADETILATLPALLTDLGRRLRALGEAAPGSKEGSVGHVPLSTQRWAAMAALSDDKQLEEGEQPLTAWFEGTMQDAFQRDDAGTILHWIKAARPLAEVLGRLRDYRLDRAVRRANLRLELLGRRHHDEQHLRHFLRRDDQLEAVRALLQGPDDAWALHLVGAGGVGKTMLVRYLSSRLSQDERAHQRFADALPATTARIDFDFINPDYPRLNPGLLLWAFAQQLRAHAFDEQAASFFDHADREFQVLSDELQSTTSGDGRPTAHPRFRRAISFYLDALRRLPQPILLILDTCEELAKVRTSSAAQENVAETLRILRALHDGPDALYDDASPTPGAGLPKLRVIFAGRRLLARSGYGWHAPEGTLMPQPFLRLYQIRGFTFPLDDTDDTDDEAGRYLRQVGVPEALIPPICRKSSPDAGDVVDVVWDDPGLQPPPEVPRCNPYELQFFLQWALEKPPPAPETIERATSAEYVEKRILERLTDPGMARILPTLGLLKFFDRGLLQAMLQPDDGPPEVADLDAFYERLIQHEWIDRRLAPGPEPEDRRLLLSIEEGLRLRLLAYYRQRTTGPTPYRRRAARYLAAHTAGDDPARHTDLASLDRSDFDAAIRALDAEPERAQSWWQRVEARLLRERDYTWIAELTDYLVAEDGAAGLPNPDRRAAYLPPASPLRPFVLATYATATLHVESAAAAAARWEEVARAVGERTDAPARTLYLRALAGQVTGARHADLDDALVERFWQHVARREALPDGETAAALVAAAETLVERADEEPGDAVRLLVVRAGDAHSPTFGCEVLAEKLASGTAEAAPREALQGLTAYAWALAGRTCARIGPPRNLQELCVRAVRLLEHYTPAAAHPWAHWQAPDDLRHRILLDATRLLYPACLSPEEIEALVSGPGDILTTLFQALDPWDDLDTDRLRSALGQVLLARGLPPFRRRGDWEAVRKQMRTYSTDGLPACYAHRVVPPFFVTAAEMWAAHGHVADAQALLQGVISQDRRFDRDTVLHAEQVFAGLAVRQRLLDPDTQGGTSRQAAAQTPHHAPPRLLDGLLGTHRDVTDRYTLAGLRARFKEAARTLFAGEVSAAEARLQSVVALALASPFLSPQDRNRYLHVLRAEFDALRQASSPALASAPASSEQQAPALSTHVAWQTTFTLHPDTRREYFTPAFHDLLAHVGALPTGDTAAYDYMQASLYLDAMEAAVLSEKPLPDGVTERLEGFARTFDPKAWWEQHPYQPEEALTLFLRYHALGGRSSGLSEPLAAARPALRTAETPAGDAPLPAGRLGRRREAEIAFREGDFASLRLPAAAARLYAYALDAFTACGDGLGAFRSAVARAGALIHAGIDPTDKHGIARLGEAVDRATSLYDAHVLPLQHDQGPPRTSDEDDPRRAFLRGVPVVDLDVLAALPAVGWHPWITRMFAYRSVHRTLKGPDPVRLLARSLLHLAPGRDPAQRIQRATRWAHRLNRYAPWFVRALVRLLHGTRPAELKTAADWRTEQLGLERDLVHHYGRVWFATDADTQVTTKRLGLPAEFTYLHASPAAASALAAARRGPAAPPPKAASLPDHILTEAEVDELHRHAAGAPPSPSTRAGSTDVEEDTVWIQDSPLPLRDAAPPAEADAPTPPPPAPEPAPAEANVPKLPRSAFPWGALLRGLGTVAGLLVGGFFLFNWLVDIMPLPGDGTLPGDSADGSTPVVGYAITLAVLLLLASGAARRAWKRRYGARLRVAGTEPDERSGRTLLDPRPATFALEAAQPKLQRLRLSQVHRMAWRSPGTSVRVEAEMPYAERARALPAEMIEALQTLRRQAGVEAFSLVVDPEPELQAFAWEGSLGMALHQREVPLTAFTITRPGGKARQRREAPSGPVGVRCWTEDLVCAQMAEQGWQRVANAPDFAFRGEGGPPGDAGQDTLSAPVAPDPNVRILHLIGSAEETNAGLRYRLYERWDFYKRKMPEEHELTARDLLTHFPNLEVCVIQEIILQDVPTDRGMSDRLKAALNRAFAAEVVRQGVAAAVVLPALPDETARAAVELLAGALRSRPRKGTDALREAAGAIRVAIQEDVRPESDPDDVLLEIAFDVTLFCPPDWNARRRLKHAR